MGERIINPILNVHDNYRMNILNPFWSTDPLLNTFTPAGNNLWSNVANWSSGHLPLSTETANISGGDITLDVVTTINKLVVATGFTLSADNSSRVLTVNDIVTVSGNINFTGSNVNLVLKGEGNIIPKANFIAGTASKVTFARVGAQTILDLNYNHLTVDQSGIKSPVANLVTTGGVITDNGVTFELGTYNLTVGGNSILFNATTSKSGAGAITFNGTLLVSGATFSLSGNPDVEYKNNVTFNAAAFTSGTGTHKFSTRNFTFQTGAGSPTATFNGPFLISGAITLTTGLGIAINNTLNGDNAASKFLNNSTVILKNTNTPMATGIFDVTTNASSTVEYDFAGNFAIPLLSYRGLNVKGTGNKTLSGNTTVNGNFSTQSLIELGVNNLTINGTIAISITNGLTKSGAGSVVFGGTITTSSGSIDFSVGNPTVEIKAGLVVTSSTANGVNNKFGTGALTFSTANLGLSIGGTSQPQTLTLENSPLLISGALAVTVNAGLTLVTKGAINGNNASSALTNLGTVEVQNASQPMSTGLFNTNTGVNTVKYSLNGNQDIKAGTYRNLSLITGGVKKLLGNVSVVNTYTLTAPATLDANGFALTNP